MLEITMLTKAQVKPAKPIFSNHFSKTKGILPESKIIFPVMKVVPCTANTLGIISALLRANSNKVRKI